jgi:biuret amidohydrolase
MQTDFCGVGGYVDKMGYDLSLTRAPIEPIRRLLARHARRGLHVIHTREGHRPDLSTCRPTSAGARSASAPASATPGPCGRILVRGEPGWEIIPELAPLPGEVGDRQARQGQLLRHRPRADPAHARHPQPGAHRHHHRRLRAHDDARGQRPRLRVPDRRDCTGATDRGNHEAALKMVTMQGGVFGAVAESSARAVMPWRSAPPRMHALSLETYGLTKRFGAFTALDDVSLTCGRAPCTRCWARTAPARARW